MPPAIYIVLGCFFSLMSAVLPPYALKGQARRDRVKVLSRVTATLEGAKEGLAQLRPGRSIPMSTENESHRARLGSARLFHTNVSDFNSSTGGLPGAVAGTHPDQRQPPVGFPICGSFLCPRPCCTTSQHHSASFPQL